MTSLSLHNNDATTTINGAIILSDTTITVTDGSVFPSPTGSEFFYATLDDGTNKEIVKCTARATNDLTVTRAQFGTAAVGFADGTVIEQRVIEDDIDRKADYVGTNYTISESGNTWFNSTAGNFGVGTSNPSDIVHIAAAAPTLRIQDDTNSGTVSQFAIEFYDSANTQMGYISYLSAVNNHLTIANEASSGNIFFRTGGSSRFFVSSAGVISFGANCAVDAGEATSFEIPNSTSPTVGANGEIALDTSVTDWSHGILKYYGGEEMGVMAMPIAEFSGMSDGQIFTYNATNDEIEQGPIYESGTWTPTFSFNTPGDLSVSYSIRSGQYVRVGNLFLITWAMTFTPTYTTSSGNVEITGVPTAPAGTSNGWVFHNSNITYPTSRTLLTSYIAVSTTLINVFGLGSGAGSTSITTANVASGVATVLNGQIIYRV